MGTVRERMDGLDLAGAVIVAAVRHRFCVCPFVPCLGGKFLSPEDTSSRSWKVHPEEAVTTDLETDCWQAVYWNREIDTVVLLPLKRLVRRPHRFAAL